VPRGSYNSLQLLLPHSDVPRATEAAGHIGAAVGLANFAPYVTPCLSLASSGFALDNLELKENTFAFFGSLASVLGGSGSPAGRSQLDALIPELAPVVLDVVKLDAGLDFVADGGSDAGGEMLAQRLRDLREEDEGGNDASDDSSGDGSDDEDGGLRVGDRVNYRVHTSIMDMRVSAVVCLGRLAQHGGPAFGPFLVSAKVALHDLVGHFHEEMREQAVASLILVAAAFNAATPPIPAGGSEPLRMRSPALEVYDEIFTALLGVLRSETSLVTVAQACVGFQKFCKWWGAGAIVRHQQALMSALVLILHERSACQLQVDDDGDVDGAGVAPVEVEGGGRRARAAAAAIAAASSSIAPVALPLPAPFVAPGTAEATAAVALVASQASALLKGNSAAASHGRSHGHGHSHGHCGCDGELKGDDGEDDAIEHDEVLIDEAVDAITAVAAALRMAFAPYLPAVMSGALRFQGLSRSVTDRIMGVGLIADLARHTGDAFAPFVPAAVPIVLRALAEKGQPGLQRNAAYAVGRLLTDVTAAARPYAAQMLTALQPLFAVPRGDSEAEHMIDNACSALALAATALPDLVPASIAVPAIAGKLPIVADHEEVGPVMRYLLGQLHARSPAAAVALPQVVVGCAAALLPASGTPAEVRDSVIAPGLRHFLRVGGADAQAAIAAAISAISRDDMRSALLGALEGLHTQ
jgi:hypothetical protein